MKTKTLSMTAGVASLLFAGAASAGYTGMSGEIVAVDGIAGSQTIRVYADFANAADQLNAVYGDSTHTLNIDASSSFYQNTFGGSVSNDINPALYAAFPSLVYDSWVTIGLEDNVENQMLHIGVDFDDFANNGGGITTDNGSWFATPDDAQVVAGAELRVMIGQFTVMGDAGSVSGVINMQGKNADGSNWVANDVAFEFGDIVPAPGVLALLGIAGLAGRRRRA